MLNVLKHISCLFFVLSPLMMQAQGVSSLGKAQEISTGSLPDGMKYYIVADTGMKGFADFALVQKGRVDDTVCREALEHLPHFGTRKPYEFLSDNGVGCSESGYMVHSESSTEYSFQQVPTYDTAVADSTLLMIFDIAAKTRVPQAVIVSGDVSASKLKERMELLSMMVPKLDAKSNAPGYIWDPKGEIAFRVSANTTDDVAAISLTYSTERLPEPVLDGPQPLLARTYAEELGHVVAGRLMRIFREEEIPLADLRYRYDDSASGPGDERYSFTAYTSSDYLSSATELIASTFADLNANGATAEEFQEAKDKVVSSARSAEAVTSSAEYVSQCASSFLYGTSLASKAARNAFISRSRLSDSRELELFNGFVKALLDSAANLTMHYDIPDQGLSAASILKMFNKAWASPVGAAEFKSDFADTLSLAKPNPSAKVKLKSTAAEPITGGSLWTFSNGIKVIYKKTANTGEFRYAMMLKGGVTLVPGLKPGESAFVSDMLPLSKVADMSGHDFREMLSANGVSMDQSASLSDFRLTGSAPTSKLSLLLRSLLSIASGRTPDASEFERYRTEERLRLDMEKLQPKDVKSLMDSIIRPNYAYTYRKYMDNLGDDLPQRAEAYFASLFSKVNDGILVFVGDIPEEVLKKELLKDLGSFKTQNRYSSRSIVGTSLLSGHLTYTVEASPGSVGGGETGVNVEFSTATPYNVSNHMSFLTASEIIRSELVRHLADKGAYVEVAPEVELYPTERFSLAISCKPCSPDGLPAGVTPSDPSGILEAVREVTSKLDEISLSDSQIKACKETLLAGISAQSGQDAEIIDAALVRYSEGKDMVTGRQEAVKAVTAASVKNILSALKNGAEVEYVVL